MLIIAQKFDNVKMLIHRILDGSEDLAEAILRKHGDFSTLPTTSFMTAKEMAKYYGITESYLRSVLNNNGINSRQDKKNVVQINPQVLKIRYPALNVRVWKDKDFYEVSGYDNGALRKYFLHRTQKILYSTKALLAIAPVIARGHSAMKSVAAKVFEDIVRCKEYTGCPMFCGFSETQEQVAEKPAAIITPDPEPATKSNSGISINLTPEMLTHIVRTAVAESVNAVWSKVMAVSNT